MKYVGIIETNEHQEILIDGQDFTEILLEMFIALEGKEPVRIEIKND